MSRPFWKILDHGTYPEFGLCCLSYLQKKKIPLSAPPNLKRSWNDPCFLQSAEIVFRVLERSFVFLSIVLECFQRCFRTFIGRSWNDPFYLNRLIESFLCPGRPGILLILNWCFVASVSWEKIPLSVPPNLKRSWNDPSSFYRPFWGPPEDV